MDMNELADKLSSSVQGTQALDNRKRAIRAYQALMTHAGPEWTEPVEDLLTDLLCNLLHLTDLGIPFAEPWQRAVRHHYEEVKGLSLPVDPQPAQENEPLHYRCPECDTYSGTFTPSDDGYMSHSICGREGLVSSFTPGTPEFERVYEGNSDPDDPWDDC